MSKPIHVSLIAIPEASIATLHGLFDVLNSFRMLRHLDDSIPESPPFAVEIVGEQAGALTLSSGLQANVQRGVEQVAATDIIIVPSVVVPAGGWGFNRYPKLTRWLQRQHERGATLCSACSGVFLIGETGLLDGRAITLHWDYAEQFRATYPRVELHPEKSLLVSGDGQLVTSGASMSWHDLVMYLIAKHVGPTVAQTLAKFFALQYHRDGLSPYMIFEGRDNHGDAAVQAAQKWLAKNFAVTNPVDAAMQRSGLAERTFKRRFQSATGYAPLAYVQRLRVEDAKRRLERTKESIDKIGLSVGYEEPGFFRRLFRRVTGVTPGQYRRQFQIPGISARPTL